MPQPIIEFENVYKFFGSHTILSDLNFQVYPGEVVVLMGASGCGKSTALKCINGLEMVQQGSIRVRGKEITAPPKGFDWNRFRSSVGIVFQQYNLFPHLTVLQNITLGPIQVKKTPPKEAIETALMLLAQVGLENKAYRYPNNLSGGEKQRVAIARALAMSTDLLLLDEPTSALDPMMTAEVLQTIHDLAHNGITLVIVTHEVNFAYRVSDRILFMADGQIQEAGPPEHFQYHLTHPLAKRYFAMLQEGFSQEDLILDS